MEILEDDIKRQLVDKKATGIKLYAGHVLTIKIEDASVPRNNGQKARQAVEKWLAEHPQFAANYAWTTEFWNQNVNPMAVVMGRKYPTIFRFESKVR